jgi:2-keto-4-pentenoate hydratase/2-oxohepta-3-ene-1,7-dioic acid hydratase in catechol pathway
LRGERAAVYAREADGLFHVLDAAPWDGGTPTGARIPAAEAVLLTPCVPSKIVCVGLNYVAHVAESSSRSTVPEEPVLFLKPPSSLLAAGEAILLPEGVGRVDHEAELAVVIGRRLHGASAVEAQRGIFGVTALNDVSARVLQKKDVQWTRAKGFDTFCPLGPAIVRGPDPGALAVRSYVNGALRQDGNTRDLIVGIAALVAFAAKVMTLEPGDVVSTGTPAGVGPIQDGDIVEIEIEGVGRLRNPVRAARSS